MADHADCEVEIMLDHQARIASLEQGFRDHERWISALESKIDKIVLLEWAVLVTVIAGFIANRLLS